MKKNYFFMFFCFVIFSFTNEKIAAQCSATITPSPASVCLGSSVTLTASGGVTYTWSANAGSSNVNTVTVSPVGNTVYTVTLTSGTCTAVQTVSVTVNALPLVTVNSQTICLGETTTLTGAGAASYTWDSGALGATISQTPTVTTQYTVTGSNAAGCIDAATATITVNSSPTITVNAPLPACPNTTQTLTAGGCVTYTWNTGATGATLVQSPAINTSYTVTGANAAGCTDQITTSITVFAQPTVNVVNPSVCPGETATLTATGALTYSWSPSAGSATTNTVVVAPFTTSVYSVTGTDVNGCKDSTIALVTVYSNTLAIAPPIGTSTLYCTGTPYQFGAVDTTTGGYFVQYYTWYSTPSQSVTIANGFCTTCNGPTITFDTTGTYTLTVIVNLNNGCLDSTKYTLSVVQTPTISTTPFAPVVCEGGPGGTTLYVVGAGVGGSYSWAPMLNIATQYAAGDSVKINPPLAGVYNYTVIGTNAAGCPSLPEVVTATVYPAPTFTAIAVDDSICSYLNTAVHMVASSSLTAAAATYTWSCGSTGNLGTPLSYTSAISPFYTGNVDTTFAYYCNVNVPGCPAYPTYSVYVVVVPTPTVILTSDTMENCNKMGDTLKVTSNPPTAVNFSWWPNYNISSLSGSSVFVHPLVPLYYYVTPSIQVGSNLCIGKRDSIMVLIGDTMNAGINVQYDIICKGMSDTLIANPPWTQLNSTYQYYWQIPNISTGTTTVTGDTLVITPTALGIYTLTVRGTCIRNPTTQMLVAVNNCVTPVPNFTETADTICRRHCVTYTDETVTYTVKPLFYMWTFTVQPPQISIFCLGAPGCVIRHDTVWFETTDSSAIPQIKVCYYQNSMLNGPFPITEIVSHNPNLAVGTMTSFTTSAITVYDGPLANGGTNQNITLGDAASLHGSLSSGTLAGIASYSWSPNNQLSCTNCANPAASPSVNTQYVLTVTDKNGCIDTANVWVYVDEFCFQPFVPTGFSPNGDGENDILYVRSQCLTNFSFKVFDRWGEKVFETSDLTHGWNGTFRGSPMNAAVFMYTLEGYMSNGKEVKQKGNITLVK